MKIFIIPISDVKNQVLTVNLGGQEVNIKLIMRLNHLFIDVICNNEYIVLSKLCLNNEPIIGYKYLPFKGELFFEDTQGNENPIYGGLGSRYVLKWISDE